MANVNFDTMLSTTVNNHLDKLEDNVFSARPLFHFLKEAGQIRKEDGGVKIVLPLIHALNQASGSYAGDDPLSTAASAGLTAAEFEWKQYYSTITISGIEELKNNGEEQVINLLEAKIMQAEETIIENLDQMFFGDGSGNSGKDWNGLGNLIKGHSATPADYARIGNIDPVANAYWASYRNPVAGSLTVPVMATAYNTVSVGADQPKAVLTTQLLFEAYEALLTNQARYTDMKTADAGFQNLMYKSAPVTYDTYCATGDMYFINPKYIRLVGHSDAWFKTTPFIRPEDVDAKYAQILLAGNLTISNRKRQGVLTGLTA